MFKPGQLPSQIPPQHPAALNIIQAANRMGIVGMTPNYLPKPDMPLHLQFLFQPRPLLVHVKPMKKNKCRQLDQFSSHDNLSYYMDKFEEVFDYSEEENEGVEKELQKVIPTSQGIGLPQKKKVVYREQKIQKHKEIIKEEMKKWNPLENENSTGDPYKTLFVARISYETTEKRLKKEFEMYGPIKQIKLIKNIQNEKPRGYCFIEYEHKRDFITAYKQADGKKIDGKRVLVDCERARVVKSWKPRRFAGGKGETRKGKDDYMYERLSRSRSRSHSHHKRKHRSKDKSKDKKKDKEREKRKHRDNNKEKDKKERKDRGKERRNEKKEEKSIKEEKDEEKEEQKEKQKEGGEQMEMEEKELKQEGNDNNRMQEEKKDEVEQIKEHSKKKKHRDKTKEKRKSKKHQDDSSSEQQEYYESKEKHKKHKHKKRKEKGEIEEQQQQQLQNADNQEQLEEGENKEREEGEQDAAELHPRKHKSKHRHRSKKHHNRELSDEEQNNNKKERKKHKHHNKEKEHRKKKDKKKQQEDQQSLISEQEFTAEQQQG